MNPDWTPLTRELDLWRANGLTLPIWWRDDDATAPTPALDRLSDLAAGAGLPVHLAIIPARARPGLAEWLATRSHMIPLVHGWAHENHAPQSEKKAEFAASRPLAARRADAARGLARLTALLRRPPAPVFVPPWNRIGADLAAALPGLGFAALSTFGPRTAPLAATGLAQINTHLDPVDWRGTRSLADPATLIAQIAGQLADRREGRADNGEPYGLLTHHLVHDAAIWDFTAELLGHFSRAPLRPWSAYRDLPT